MVVPENVFEQFVQGNAIKLVMPSSPVASYDSSIISGSLEGSTVNLNWTKVGSDGFVYYKVMYSFTDSSPVYGESGCDYYAYYTNPSDLSCAVNVNGLNGYTAGSSMTCYFSITAVYDGGKKAGNTIAISLP